MSDVKDHYDGLLGSVYSWILGDFESAYARNIALFDRLGITSIDRGKAVDLGSGPGCQSIPLAERGYDVVAVDFCERLLEELAGRAGDLPVRPVCDDILVFDRHIDGPVDLIVCMGDTLCHLPDTSAVSSLVAGIARQLAPNGQFIASFRDYVSSEPVGAERFIPVRSDDEQIFTCFVDYQGEHVNIHDILYRKVDGEWELEISEYNKIKIDPESLVQELRTHGMTVERLDDNGMIVLRARKDD